MVLVEAFLRWIELQLNSETGEADCDNDGSVHDFQMAVLQLRFECDLCAASRVLHEYLNYGVYPVARSLVFLAEPKTALRTDVNRRPGEVVHDSDGAGIAVVNVECFELVVSEALHGDVDHQPVDLTSLMDVLHRHLVELRLERVPARLQQRPNAASDRGIAGFPADAEGGRCQREPDQKHTTCGHGEGPGEQYSRRAGQVSPSAATDAEGGVTSAAVQDEMPDVFTKPASL